MGTKTPKSASYASKKDKYAKWKKTADTTYLIHYVVSRIIQALILVTASSKQKIYL